MKKRVKKREHENLTDTNISKVISLLGGSKPITKKQACDILNISYNTTRLTNIIQQFESDKEYRIIRKAQKRGRPADNQEIAEIAESFLSGKSYADIAKSIYRSSSFVRQILLNVGVPERIVGEDKHRTEMLPENCVSEDFSVGETVWSAIHHTPAIVIKQLPEKYNKTYNTNCFKIWVKEPSEHLTGGGYNSFVPSYDLGKLKHLEAFGVNVERL